MVQNAGLYIHVPFCRRHCPFCDFAITTRLSLVGEWEEALRREMALQARSWDVLFDTAYFGGGTPSLIGADGLGGILQAVRGHFELDGGSEVTLEANPGTLEGGEFARLIESGFNRLSLGLQSFDDADLLLLGRDHTVRESEDSFRRARAEGFANISIDLIYGLPGRSLEEWRSQIDQAVDLGPEHISAFFLTFEPGTPLTRRLERGEFEELSEAAAREFFLLTHERLAEAGYQYYEVSSFSRDPKSRSRHNQKYWAGAPYLGLGPSAHSYRNATRSWNTRHVSDYVAALSSGKPAVAGEETLGRQEKCLERLFLGLRTHRGIELGELKKEFGLDLLISHQATVKRLLGESLAVQEGGRLILTRQGLATADAIALELSKLNG